MSHYLMMSLRLSLNNIPLSEASNLLPPLENVLFLLDYISPWIPRLGLNLHLPPLKEVRGRYQ